MVRICTEEGFHMKQGKEMVIRYARGTPRQQAMVQDALNRWWWPSLMMFGPHDTDSPNSGTLLRWGIKTRTNDQLRQEFLNELVPELHALGLALPDPALRYDEATRNWLAGPIDWDEFWRVVKGDGPCNKDRLDARRRAHDDGQWVRAALSAYAQKQLARSAA
jgi:ring-1,2-phenylacetyl-CoA epoxidase subunit PaaA